MATTRKTAASPNAGACACGRLRRATRAITQLYDDALAPAGLRVTQFSLLRTLERNATLTISALAEALLLDRTALSRNLDPLLARGWVEVIPGRDARTREVTITPDGRATLAAASPRWRRVQHEVERRLGSARLDQLIDVLADVETLHPGSPAAPGASRTRPA